MSWSSKSPADAAPCEQRGKSSVLVVDDDVDSREIFALLLQTAGHTVRTAKDGEEALAVAKTFGPDVIFMDIEMPKMDGYIACQTLRKLVAFQKTRIYAVSGITGGDHERRCAQAGFDGQISKPADLNFFSRLL
ncbi:MAG TPA: response regulator [Steroidobacteraceae bacterium]